MKWTYAMILVTMAFSLAATADGIEQDQLPTRSRGLVITPGQHSTIEPKASPVHIFNLDACPTVCENAFSVIREKSGSTCIPRMKLYCGPYLCDQSSGLCKTSCQKNSDCGSGGECNVVTRQCVYWTYKCKDDRTVVSAAGYESDCAPYKCTAGVCRDSCVATSDCSWGYDCKGGNCYPVK